MGKYDKVIRAHHGHQDMNVTDVITQLLRSKRRSQQLNKMVKQKRTKTYKMNLKARVFLIPLAKCIIVHEQ